MYISRAIALENVMCTEALPIHKTVFQSLRLETYSLYTTKHNKYISDTLRRFILIKDVTSYGATFSLMISTLSIFLGRDSEDAISEWY